MAPDFAQNRSVLAGPALHEAKRALRLRMIAARDAIPATTRGGHSAAITTSLASLPSFMAAQCVLLTLPFRSEFDTRPLLASALAAGKVVALPRVNTATRMLELHRIGDFGKETAIGYRGIPEPLSTLPRIALDAIEWVLVPGVAFDATGRRLGYGGGFYDRLLSLVPATIPRIAGAFAMQVVPQVPAAPHDLTVAQIVTEHATLVCPATA